MIWLFLQILTLSVLRWQEMRGVQEIDLAYSLVLLAFCMLWPGSRQAPEWRTLVSLLFTSLSSFTGLMLLLQGPMGSLAVCWPAVLCRMEPERSRQRAILVALQLALVMAALDQPLLFSLTIALMLASLVQLSGYRATRWFAVGAMAAAAGPLAVAFCMAEPSEFLIKNTLLLVLPQLGLLALCPPAKPARELTPRVAPI